MRQYTVFWQKSYISAIWGNSCQTSQKCTIIFQILSLEISTSQISTALEETQKKSEKINQTLTRTTTQVSHWFIIYSLLYSEIILQILFQPAKTVDILRRHIWLALLIGQPMEEGNRTCPIFQFDKNPNNRFTRNQFEFEGNLLFLSQQLPG